MNRKTPDRIPPASPATIRDSRIARNRTRESVKELVHDGQFLRHARLTVSNICLIRSPRSVHGKFRKMTYLPSILIGTEVCIRATRPANKLAEVALDRFSAKNSERIHRTPGCCSVVAAQGRYAAHIKAGRTGEHL